MKPLSRPSEVPFRSHRAFTVAEVMFATLVLIFAITSAISVIQRGFNSIDSSRNYIVAGQIIQSEVERIRVSPWTTTSTVTGIADYTDSFPAVSIDSAFTSNTYIGTRFTLSRSVSDLAAGYLRQFTLTVSWNNYDGRPMSCSMVTYYSRYGLYDYFSS